MNEGDGCSTKKKLFTQGEGHWNEDATLLGRLLGGDT